MSAVQSLSGGKRTWRGPTNSVKNDPKETLRAEWRSVPSWLSLFMLAEGRGRPFDRAWIALDLALQVLGSLPQVLPAARPSSYHAMPSVCVPAGVVGSYPPRSPCPAASVLQD
jgi:hypothetical protein